MGGGEGEGGRIAGGFRRESNEVKGRHRESGRQHSELSPGLRAMALLLNDSSLPCLSGLRHFLFRSVADAGPCEDVQHR